MTKHEALVLAGWSLPPQLERKRDRILSAKHPKVKAARSQRGAAVSRKSRRLTKNEETARIREAVFARAAPYAGSAPACELCEPPFRLPATELAHLEGGVGRKTQRQAVRNTAASCRDCNRGWDNHPERRPAMAVWWSDRTGLPIPPGILAAAALKGWTVPESRASTRTNAPPSYAGRETPPANPATPGERP